jgi:hypothetical protein
VSEPTDPLETELAALRPQPLSPETRSRVAARLAASRPYPWRRALAGALVLIAILAVAIPWKKEPLPPVLPPVPPPAEPPTPATTEPDSPPPSVLAYQRALARSPEAFDALLDQQSVSTPGPVATPNLSRSPAALESLIGDN